MSLAYRLLRVSELDQPLLEAWRRIRAATPALASPYFAPEFSQAVAAVRKDVWVTVIESDQRPAGFFPHQRSSTGMGKPVGGPLSDFHGVIAAPDCEWELAALMRASRLSVWAFDHLVGDVARFRGHLLSSEPSPQVGLGCGYDAYVEGRRAAGSDYIRKTEGLARKLAKDCGELSFSLHDGSAAVLNQLFEWKTQQYQRARLINIFGVAWTRDLLHRLASIQERSFGGLVSVLRAGDKVIAVHMGMRSDGVFHYWFPAYDPEFAKYSSGIILFLRMAQTLAADGVGIIDLGKGESQYKQRLMTGAVDVHLGMVEVPSWLASARQLQRRAETAAQSGGLAAALRLPLRAIRRLERERKFK